MQKLLLFLCAVMVLYYACSNKNNTTPPSATTELPQSTGPDGSDLLKTLQGRWQSEQDPAVVIEILDTKMRYFQGGQQVEEVDIDVDGACSGKYCVMDSTVLIDGWCFTEKSKSGLRCNIVVTCDKNRLSFGSVETPDHPRQFRKL